jgi:hypothetical protein
VKNLTTLFLSGALLGLIGCGKYHPKPPATVPAGGKVLSPTGQPLKSGMVTFIPDDIAVGREVGGMLGTDGSFKLDYRDGGAVPGKYTVILDPNMTLPGQQRDTSVAVPAKYVDASTSPWKAEIKAGQPNEFTLQME